MRPGRTEGRGSCLLEAAESEARPAPGARVLRWKPLPALPAGLTLAPRAARSAAFLAFRGRSSPRRPGPGARPCFGKPWGLGASETRDGTPKLGCEARFRRLLPSRVPWRGAYPCGRPGARLLTPGQASSSSGDVYAVRFATAPSAFPAARKSWSASATGRLDVMPIGELPQNCESLLQNKIERLTQCRPGRCNFSLQKSLPLPPPHHPLATRPPPGQAGTSCIPGPS